MYNCLSIHETVQLIVMHATHTVTLLVRLKCRGHTMQFKERERGREREKGKENYILKLKNYAMYKALIGYNRQPHTSLLLFTCEKILKIAALT